MAGKRTLRFVVLFAWTCGALIGGLGVFTVVGLWQQRIVRVDYVRAQPETAAKVQPRKPFAHVKGYERDSRNRGTACYN